jgi:hypothetical protein
MLVFAYDTNFVHGNAPLMGHSADEILIKQADGSLVSLQTLLRNGLKHTHTFTLTDYPRAGQNTVIVTEESVYS